MQLKLQFGLLRLYIMGWPINCIVLEAHGLKASSEKVEMFIQQVDKIFMTKKKIFLASKYSWEAQFKLKQKQTLECGKMKRLVLQDAHLKGWNNSLW